MNKGEHRIQVRLDDERYEKVRRATAANGLARASALCEMLLEQEYARLGFDRAKAGASVVADDEVERRMNVRVKEPLWVRGRERAAALGLKTLSDLCRVLLEKDLESWERELSRSGGRKKAKGKPRRL